MNFTSNPLFQQAQKMAQGKSEAELMEIARNICLSKGIDYDSAYAQFKNLMKGM
jgi:hypothetical protein